MKKTIAVSLVSGAMMLGAAFPALAEEMTTSTKVKNVPFDASKAACIAAAVATREGSLGTAIGVNTAAVNAAYSARKTALAAAYTKTDVPSIKAAVKDAWVAFGASMKVARKEWQASRQNAWNTFKKSSKECRAPASIGDAGNMGLEASGN